MRETVLPERAGGEPADWRELQKRQTRQRITRAVHELVAETGQFSIRQVSERCGVSPATIYRHFPDRQSLLSASAYEHVDTGLRPGAEPISLQSYRQVIQKVWAAHEADLATVIAAQATPAGREMRRIRGANRVGIVRENVLAGGFDPDSPAGQRLVALIAVITSSRSFMEFHEMTDLSTEDAADAVVWAMQALIHATQEGRELLDDDRQASEGR